MRLGRIASERCQEPWAGALAGVIVAMSIATASAAAAEDQPERLVLDAFVQQIDGLGAPTGADALDSGEFLVVESLARRIVRLGPDGPRTLIGGERSGETRLLEPHGVASLGDGRFAITDASRHEVLLFDAEGRLLKTLGERGRGEEALLEPRGIVRSGDRLLVVDSGNHRVKLMEDDGRIVRIFGEYGHEQGELNRPFDVAVDDSGNVYVADTDNNRIVVFDHEGQFIRQWGEYGVFPGMLSEPTGVTWYRGLVFVADSRNHRIQAFDPEGTLVQEFGKHVLEPHEGSGKVHYPNDLIVAADGAQAWILESFEDRMQQFTLAPPKPPIDEEWFPPGTSYHYGRQMDIDGRLMVTTEPDGHAVLVHDLSRPTPIMITKFGGYGNKPGQFIRPWDVDLDLDRMRLLVSDRGNRRLQVFKVRWDPDERLKFDPEMCVLERSFDLHTLSGQIDGQVPDQVIDPVAIDHDAEGRLYLLDATSCRVIVLDAEMRPVNTWGGYGGEEMQFLKPVNLRLDPSRTTVVIVDEIQRAIHRFSLDGAWLGRWDLDALGVVAPSGIAIRQQPIDAFGGESGHAADIAIFVSDAGTDRILELDQRGDLSASFGRRGLGAIEFFKPQGLGWYEPRGLIVIDYGNHRGQIITPDRTLDEAFGARMYIRPAQRQAADEPGSPPSIPGRNGG